MKSILGFSLAFTMFLLPMTLLGKDTHCGCTERKIVIVNNGKVLSPTDPEALKILERVNQEIVSLEEWENDLWERLSQLESLFLEKQRELFKIQQELLKNLKKSTEPFWEEQKPNRKTLPQPKNNPIPFPQGQPILVSSGR
ncbi:hypothetical protein [Methylacidiphilum caldifontis]|uniref:Uncharacterized protein n=1 Tax=Methylacidiphilum caldifontis TaxID=2795386 RepID=A0A4Y8PGK3_9BACT|nr:hypothetical protein [Methylacidiphilum caldifontis]QSR88423.1 hypothetical protein IT6_08590 [Methylacidiphilum caldifontis]TFE71252.1 hypothetical protein A7Q10_04525 [Methylacidiphilum caldifontis]